MNECTSENGSESHPRCPTFSGQADELYHHSQLNLNNRSSTPKDVLYSQRRSSQSYV